MKRSEVQGGDQSVGVGRETIRSREENASVFRALSAVWYTV